MTNSDWTLIQESEHKRDPMWQPVAGGAESSRWAENLAALEVLIASSWSLQQCLTIWRRCTVWPSARRERFTCRALPPCRRSSGSWAPARRWFAWTWSSDTWGGLPSTCQSLPWPPSTQSCAWLAAIALPRTCCSTATSHPETRNTNFIQRCKLDYRYVGILHLTQQSSPSTRMARQRDAAAISEGGQWASSYSTIDSSIKYLAKVCLVASTCGTKIH